MATVCVWIGIWVLIPDGRTGWRPCKMRPRQIFPFKNFTFSSRQKETIGDELESERKMIFIQEVPHYYHKIVCK